MRDFAGCYNKKATYVNTTLGGFWLVIAIEVITSLDSSRGINREPCKILPHF